MGGYRAEVSNKVAGQAILTVLCFLVQEGSTDSLYELPQRSYGGQEFSPVPRRRPCSPKCLVDSSKWGGSEPCIALVSTTPLSKPNSPASKNHFSTLAFMWSHRLFHVRLSHVSEPLVLELNGTLTLQRGH